ncbi:MAG: phosphodiester glycosidase family protein, partial [Prevotella sp.]
MRNKFFIGLLLGLFLPLHLVSQTREDVVAINTAMWETKKIS